MANIDTDAPLPAVYSIEEFCRAHRISPSSFYKMKKLGLTPVEIHFGGRRLISHEAAAEWRLQRAQQQQA